jgi:hypothetical protein
MTGKKLIIALAIVFCLGVWLGMHVERWLTVDGCLDLGGRVDIQNGFYNCDFG